MIESEVLSIIKDLDIHVCLDREEDNNYGGKSDYVTAKVTLTLRGNIISESEDIISLI